MNKPNIIFLMTDQHRWDCLGAFNSQIKTPNLDRVAAEGIIYKQAVCQAPMCVPSRNSMMFGLYPSQLGVRTNGGGFYFEDKKAVPVLPEIMKDAGYQTAGFGKTHWNHGHINTEPPTRGFEERAIGQSPDSHVYESGALMMGNENPEALNSYFEETRDYGSGEENANGYIGCTSQVPAENHRDGWVAKKCMEFLDQGVDDEKPLFLYLSFLKPHAGFNVPKEFEDLYDIEDIPDIPQPPWSEEKNTHLDDGFEELAKRRDKWFDTWENLSSKERRRTTLRYWANCSWLDNYFGQVLEKLEELGRLENTLIIFTSDHGDMMGERNHFFSKYCLYDSSVRVPLILSGSIIPDEKRGTIDERPAELIDLVPTIKAAMGEENNPLLSGLDLLSEKKRPGSFCELHGGGSEDKQPAPAYMWRKKEWKLILYQGGTLLDAVQRTDKVKGELYNLEEDPHEWENLYFDDNYASVREEMKTELLMHLASSWARGPFYFDKDGYRKLGFDKDIS
ncbi:sulfatase family protein [Natronospora cellulosivora (SeqCode)]